MANLFWKTKTSTIGLLETPFSTEDQFERTIFETAALLEDIFLIKRQVRGGSKTGIPDIVGIDGDGNMCIIELKNVEVDASVIPQVLEYAIWAETNPDSIKSLWLEADNRPDDLEVDWDEIEVRIIVIAPSILRSTLQYVQRINYPVDLLEVKRWVEGDNQIIMVNRLEQEERKPRAKPVKGLPSYDETFYKSQRNKQSVDEFLRFAAQTADFVQSRGWPLEQKFNKYYCTFKAGFFNVFSIRWMGTKSFAFVFKIPQKEALSLGLTPTKYDEQRGKAYYYVDPAKTKVDDFTPYFENSYKKFAGG